MERKPLSPRPSKAVATTPAKRRSVPTPSTAGRRLVAELSKDADPYSVTLLIIEAGRIADRLETLNGLLTGDRATWLTVGLGRDKVIEVRVDNVLSEARAQTTVMRHLFGEIHRQRAGIPLGPDDDDDLAGI